MNDSITYSIQTLYLFPVFQTREEYKAKVGNEPPPFDPSKPVKCWLDPQAHANPRRKIVYDNVLAIADNGAPLVDADGKPFFEPLLIDREDAGTVNIPIKDFTGNIPEQQATGTEVPVPLRALMPNEELVMGGFGNLVTVRNKTFLIETAHFTVDDRKVLHAIAVKLGVV